MKHSFLLSLLLPSLSGEIEKIVCAGFTYPTVATYACPASGQPPLDGDTTRTCMANGGWTGTPPTCPLIWDTQNNIIYLPNSVHYIKCFGGLTVSFGVHAQCDYPLFDTMVEDPTSLPSGSLKYMSDAASANYNQNGRGDELATALGGTWDSSNHVANLDHAMLPWGHTSCHTNENCEYEYDAAAHLVVPVPVGGYWKTTRFAINL